jgi:DNA-directed RNA polymerase subunit omega
MAYIPMEKVIQKNEDSTYKIILAVAKRANELAAGAQPLVKTDSKKASTIALQEFAEGKVRYEEVKSKSKKTAG